MFCINAISIDGSREERCFVFESYTIAQIIADKLERGGFVTQILDQEFQPVSKTPRDPLRRLLGIHRPRPTPNGWTVDILLMDR